MGMSDQYDDGRYDGGHRYAETSIGYLPITAVRGGIKYPKPKETHMALTPKQKVRKLEAELDSNLTLQQQLKKEEELLRKDIRKCDVPNPPPAAAGDMFRVIVQFSNGPTKYTYLLARSGQRWYTTGTHDDQKMFPNWEALCAWLNTTHWHSHVERLQVTGKTNWPTEYEMPF